MNQSAATRFRTRFVWHAGELGRCGLLLVVSAVVSSAAAQSSNLMANPEPSSSIMAQTVHEPLPLDDDGRARHALRSMSMFAVAPPEPRTFQRHDLIQIIVREQSEARSRHEVDLEKDYKLKGRIAKFPRLSLPELLELRIPGTSSTDMPELDLDFAKGFEGDGDYRRRDNLSSRITAEVVEVLPNGNMVLEARTHIKIDKEESMMKLTGVCRPDDVTAVNTILSNQIHNLKIERVHSGELRRTNEKGVIAKVLDTIFAF